MTYRTQLTDPHGTGERPVQAFHPTQAQAYDWAQTVLTHSGPLAYVRLYLEVEVTLHTWTQPGSLATGPLTSPVERKP